MKGRFFVEGLGQCLVGTYALRNLTKHFKCDVNRLLFLATEEGMSLEFTSYFLKYSFDNAQMQQFGAGFKEKSVEEIDLFLDTNEISTDTYQSAFDALWISIVGMTSAEFANKNKKQESADEEQKKTNLNIQNIGNQ